jgi:GNAT superfamily N-acetyltransferase
VGIEITTDVRRMECDRIYGWLSGEAYWSRGIPRHVFDRSIDNSVCFGALQDGVLVGFTRVVTDRATFAWVCDVFVSEPARGSGVGKRLIEAVVAHPDLQGLRITILSTRDAHGLYEQYGFKSLEHPDRFMAIYLQAAELYGDGELP